jgi:hypothetical protein
MISTITNLTREQAIVLSLIEELKDIKKLNGYRTDIGSLVDHWRTEKFEAEIPEAINVKDYDATNREESENGESPSLEVVIEIGCNAKKDPWKFCTDGIRDVKIHLGVIEKEFNEKFNCEPFESVSHGILDMNKADGQGEAHVTIKINFTTDRFLEKEENFTIEVD